MSRDASQREVRIVAQISPTAGHKHMVFGDPGDSKALILKLSDSKLTKMEFDHVSCFRDWCHV